MDDELSPGWYFWQICGWYGVYSKYHWLTPECRGTVAKTWSAWTACGRAVCPELGGTFCKDRRGESVGKRCKMCERKVSSERVGNA